MAINFNVVVMIHPPFPISLYMRLCGFKGWTSLWGVIYIMPWYENDQGLIRHEMKHLEQMERDGKLVFMLKNTWWLLRYGYLNNPYEVEARVAQFREV